jgi:hypothetical protein
MKIERIFLSGFLAVSCVFLSGYIMAGESHGPIVTQQKSDVEEKRHDPQKTFKTNRKKAAKKRKSGIAKPSDADKSALVQQKPLDLSIPYTDVEKNGLTTGQEPEIPSGTTNIFASENKKKTLPVQVDGRLLMSQEPEAEKQKSADGAGIVINLKP